MIQVKIRKWLKLLNFVLLINPISTGLFCLVVALGVVFHPPPLHNPISTGLFCLVVALGVVFHPPPSITPLSLKLDWSNFVQSDFEIGWTIFDKKSESNEQWRHYDVIIPQVGIKSAKKRLFWNSCHFSIFHSILLKFGRNISNTQHFRFKKLNST